MHTSHCPVLISILASRSGCQPGNLHGNLHATSHGCGCQTTSIVSCVSEHSNINRKLMLYCQSILNIHCLKISCLHTNLNSIRLGNCIFLIIIRRSAKLAYYWLIDVKRMIAGATEKAIQWKSVDVDNLLNESNVKFMEPISIRNVWKAGGFCPELRTKIQSIIIKNGL